MGHGLSGIGLALVGGLLGACVGSFVGNVVMREPQGWRGLVLGRSSCPHCGVTLQVRDLVPILSWLASRGRCRHCGTAVSPFYPVVELAGALVGLAAFGLVAPSYAVQAAVLGWWLVALALIDLRSWRLPDVLTLPLLALGLVAAALNLLPGPGLWLALVGAGVGYLVLAGLAWLYGRLRGREGLGLGDAKLLAAAGAWLGPAELPALVLAAALLGLALALVRGEPLRGDTPVPFGPPLALAFWALFLLQASR